MNKLSTALNFVQQKWKVLALLFLMIGILSSTIVVVLLTQRPQEDRSRASSSFETDGQESLTTFTSPQNNYAIRYDPRQWSQEIQPDSDFGSRVLFSLQKEYGSARVDIIEGESEKDLTSLTNEITARSHIKPISIQPTQLKGKDTYKITYKENILGKDAYYYQWVIKNGNIFFIIETRAPQLGYDQFYVDNLLQGISLSGSEFDRTVKGASTTSENLSTEELVDLVRPSIVNILHVYCVTIENLEPNVSRLLQPQYKFCGMSKGSGFMVSEEGVVATNGHVTKIYPEEALVQNVLYKDNKPFALDLIRGMYASKGLTPTQNEIEDFYNKLHSNPQYLDRLLTETFGLIDKKIISLHIVSDAYYLNVGNEPVRIDQQKIQSGDYLNSVIPSSTTYTAKLLDFDYPNRYSYNTIVKKIAPEGSDVALLEIENPSNNLFPALELGTFENVKEGSDVIIVGYPTLVEGTEGRGATISYDTSTKPTVTKGIVSAIKQDSSGRNIVQTDASVDHGSSGGPAFDTSGFVIGIATFMVESQTGNFNFLRSVSDLKTLMSKNTKENTIGKLTTNWREGLINFRNHYYQKAIKNFQEVERLNSSHPTVKNFIDESNAAIQKGESLEGFNWFIKSEQASNILIALLGGLSIVSFMIAGFLVLLGFFQNRPILRAN